jgi:nicotinamidase-related amidase
MTAMVRRKEHLVEGTAAVELVPEIGAQPGDITSHRRHGVSPFHATSLDPTLRALGVSTVVTAGVSLNLGLIGLAIEAVNLGYRVVAATDAMTGVPLDYAQAVVRHTLALVATLSTVDDVVRAFDSVA